MKREPKPFVVEVKRGGRRSSFLGPLDKTEPMSEAVLRAERALFAGPSSDDASPKAPNAEPAGRILRSLVEPGPVEVDEPEEPAPRRRGRKPGSKNKVKAVAAPDHEDMSAPGARSVSPLPRAPWLDDAPTVFVSPASAAVEEDAEDDADLDQESAAAIESGVILGATAVHPAGLGRTRLRERSLILARYVFETEPIPGERWKRSTRRAERRKKLSMA